MSQCVALGFQEDQEVEGMTLMRCPAWLHPYVGANSRVDTSTAMSRFKVDCTDLLVKHGCMGYGVSFLLQSSIEDVPKVKQINMKQKLPININQ